MILRHGVVQPEYLRADTDTGCRIGNALTPSIQEWLDHVKEVVACERKPAPCGV